MPFVLGASIAATWVFADGEHPVAERALAELRTDEAVVPTLWWFEVRNILIASERRKRLTESDTRKFLRDVSRLSIRADHAPDEGQVLRLARRHRLSVYGASYLELAQRRGLSLATIDIDLAKVARAIGVPIVGEG